MTLLSTTSDFMTGAVLSWGIPIVVVFSVLVWWTAVLAIRAFRGQTDSG